jgi:hypothetical protein
MYLSTKSISTAVSTPGWLAAHGRNQVLHMSIVQGER